MNELERARRCAETMYANDNASKALGIEIEVRRRRRGGGDDADSRGHGERL